MQSLIKKILFGKEIGINPLGALVTKNRTIYQKHWSTKLCQVSTMSGLWLTLTILHADSYATDETDHEKNFNDAMITIPRHYDA